MKSEVKNLVQRCQGLETFQSDCNKKVCTDFDASVNPSVMFMWEEFLITLTTDFLSWIFFYNLDNASFYLCSYYLLDIIIDFIYIL